MLAVRRDGPHLAQHEGMTQPPFEAIETIWSDSLSASEELERMRDFCLDLAQRLNDGIPAAGDGWRLASLSWPLYPPRRRGAPAWNRKAAAELDDLD